MARSQLGYHDDGQQRASPQGLWRGQGPREAPGRATLQVEQDKEDGRASARARLHRLLAQRQEARSAGQLRRRFVFFFCLVFEKMSIQAMMSCVVLFCFVFIMHV